MPALHSPAGFSSASFANTPAESLLAVCCPGNMGPHFRVQTLAEAGQSPSQWKLFASFSELSLAQICLERLRRAGQSARLIAYRRVPTAA